MQLSSGLSENRGPHLWHGLLLSERLMSEMNLPSGLLKCNSLSMKLLITYLLKVLSLSYMKAGNALPEGK